MSQISIIIPVWNLWEVTKACLESIAKACSQDILLDSLEIIVVDNNSTDATSTELAPTLQALFGSMGRVITMPENLGFAKACNAGARAAKTPFFFFLNNDTLLTENCLLPLTQALENNPKLGAVGPLLAYENGKVQHAGICFSPALELVHAHQFIDVTYVQSLKQRFWQAITGAAVLIPAHVFWECGGFHEEYINGYEDLDLCCQLREKGYLLTVVHESLIYHLTSQTPGRFDFDSHNAALLGQRCSASFVPDQHTVALEANLQARLSPDLELYYDLPLSDDLALTEAFTTDFDAELCQKKLNHTPYWLNGYAILAKYWEKERAWDKALSLHLQLAQLAPLTAHYASLAFCAANIDEAAIVAQARHCLKDIMNKVKNKEALIKKAQHIKTWAEQNKDSSLETLLNTWIQKYNKDHEGM